MKVLYATFHVVKQAELYDGETWDQERISELDQQHREGPATFSLPDPNIDPQEEIVIELSHSSWRRVLPSSNANLATIRQGVIGAIVNRAFCNYDAEIDNIVESLATWMETRDYVRVIGAGRANLAASLPANRLAHGGAHVSVIGDRAPVANSRVGGAVIALSASGDTPEVLGTMQRSKSAAIELTALGKPALTVVGFSDAENKKFAGLCSDGFFVGIDRSLAQDVFLRSLADLEEYALSEIFDAVVVLAGKRIGAVFSWGHENLVATGPWTQDWVEDEGKNDQPGI